MASVNGLPISIKGSLDDSLYISAIIAEDGLSQVPMIQVELATKDTNIGLKDFLGEHYQLEVGEGDSFREFSGYCTEAEYLGTQSNWALYGLTLHPFMWFLTKTKNSRVFQGLKIEEIFDKILKDHGFDHDLDVQLGDPTMKRDYCVQYRETDFDFISRLMEEEGVFYHFDFKGGQGKMVLSNASSRLPDFDGISKLEYAAAAQGQADPYQQLYKWSSEQRVVTGKVSLNDYDFERPKAKLETATEIAQGSHKFNKIESYDYQSHIPSGGDGKNLTRVSVQSHAALAATWRGETDLCHVTVGKMFS
ncbi:MAG: type VI secretion system Vgr family protein, partial [Planktomarina sp.]